MSAKNMKLIGLLFLSFPAWLYAQEVPLDTLVRSFRLYRENTLQEKMYAHLDRDFYLTGETLWFRIYAVDGSFHKPVRVSKVAYAEVLDNTDFPVLQAKIELKNGAGSGSFFLPASLNTGNYKFRVYTNWMKNFGPEFYFDAMVSIVNPFVVPDRAQNSSASACAVEFFPEGGNLVAGISSKVAFRISGPSGRGCIARGSILTDRGDTVTTFAPGRFGIGNFLFTPREGQSYSAVVRDTAGATRVHPLPAVHPAGYVMQVADTAAMVRIIVRSKGMSDAPLYLFVHARQVIARAEKQTPQHNTATFLLPKADLPPGISHITLFDPQLNPVCERLYFTYPRSNLDIDVATNARVYNFRRKVRLSVNTADDDGKPVKASLSLSVFKTDSLSHDTPADIGPYLWLSSDLAGRIESPGYYFKTTQAGVAQAMDNLMLTHGWRRFRWQDVVDRKRSYTFLPEVNGHIINGVVTREGKPEGGVFTYLGSPGRIVRAYGSWSTREGAVRFEIKDFYGPRRIIIQTNTDSTQTYQVAIQNPFSRDTDGDKLPGLMLEENTRRDLLARSIAMQVQEIYYGDEQEKFAHPEIDSSAFYGQADNTYFLDDYTRFPVMEEVMREYVPAVFVRKRKDGFHFMVVNANGGMLPGDPMVLVDGIPVFDVDDVMKLDPLKVKKLDVVKHQYYLGQSVFSGIVSYSTYNGDLAGLDLDPRSVTLNYDGLQLQREFYSPRYNTAAVDERMPDQRHLLHWQPDLTTDETGKQQVEFYTSDVPGLYTVVIQGLTEDGRAGSKTVTFSVEASDAP